MKQSLLFSLIVLFAVCLPSCEFNCSVGDKNEPTGKAVIKDDARIYNNIKLNSYKAKLERAYLVFEDGSRVPDDNFVDFSQPVKLMLVIESGWLDQNGQVFLGAAEKIVAEDGTILLDEPDLFSKFADGISVKDAGVISLTASLKLKKDIPPTSFSVQFRVWDKKADGFIEGSYMLFSK